MKRKDVKELVWTPGYSHAFTPQAEFLRNKPTNSFCLKQLELDFVSLSTKGPDIKIHTL